MTYIPGIEGLHAWTPPGAGAAAVTLGEAPYRIIEITGLSSLGDSEDNRDLVVGAVGERARRSQRRGKSIAYVGRIEAETLLELREAEAKLRAAFADQTTEGRMDLSPHPDNSELAGQAPLYLEARALNCDIPDVQATKRWWRPFVVGIRMGDARVWDTEMGSSEINIAKTATPEKAVIAIDGSAKAPAITLELPKTSRLLDVVLTNLTTGKSLTLNLPSFWQGAILTLDFTARTITDESGADRSSLLSQADLSLWLAPPLPAGVNEIEVVVWEIASTIKAPATVANDATAGGTAWTNPANAAVKDGTLATVALAKGAKSQYLKGTKLAAGLPAGTIMTGFGVLSLEKGNETKYSQIGLVVGGLVQSLFPFAAGGPPAALTQKELVPGNSEWFRFAGAIPASLVNEEGFGFVYSVEGLNAGASASIDGLELRIYYRSLTPATYAAKAAITWISGHY